MAKDVWKFIELDVDYNLDARVIELSPLAELLYIRTLCFTERMDITWVRMGQIDRFGGDLYGPGTTLSSLDELVSELVKNGLFDRVSDDKFEVLVAK